MAGPDQKVPNAAWVAVSAAFGSLGRVCMALDAEFRVLHASEYLDDLLGAGASGRVVGRPVDSLLGPELFGEGGILRQALAGGERREGWRGSLRVEPSGSRSVSVTAAPLKHDDYGVCDPSARYIVVVRPAEDEGAPAGAPGGYGGFVFRSAAMNGIVHLIENLEHTEATVLITGETGTGKEVVARAIHAHSPRRDGAFVAVNCGALPGELLESELFGHVRGAFTGAVRDRVGRFEAAGGGTIFLDEVGDVPLKLQVKLLRVLQDRLFERVGESSPRKTDARIIAATNVDLRRAVSERTFRSDLYYRLRVVPIEVPPLRDRPDDIEPLARHLLARVGVRNGRAVRFSPDALRVLLRYRWPGNVRELENALEYAVTVARGQTLMPGDLPAEVSGTPPASPPTRPSSTREALAQSPADGGERDRLRKALEASRWRRTEAARTLGMSRTTLWRKMRELGLAKP